MMTVEQAHVHRSLDPVRDLGRLAHRRAHVPDRRWAGRPPRKGGRWATKCWTAVLVAPGVMVMLGVMRVWEMASWLQLCSWRARLAAGVLLAWLSAAVAPAAFVRRVLFPVHSIVDRPVGWRHRWLSALPSALSSSLHVLVMPRPLAMVERVSERWVREWTRASR